MNDMTPVPRSKQRPITIRSDRAALALRVLTKNGQSQAEVIEDALDRAVAAQPKLTPEQFKAEVEAMIRAIPPSGLTFKEIDDEMWDEFGLPI